MNYNSINYFLFTSCIFFCVHELAHVATTDKRKHTLKANSDAKEARWLDIEKLPDLAFDHKEIVEMAVEQL